MFSKTFNNLCFISRHLESSNKLAAAAATSAFLEDATHYFPYQGETVTATNARERQHEEDEAKYQPSRETLSADNIGRSIPARSKDLLGEVQSLRDTFYLVERADSAKACALETEELLMAFRIRVTKDLTHRICWMMLHWVFQDTGIQCCWGQMQCLSKDHSQSSRVRPSSQDRRSTIGSKT